MKKRFIERLVEVFNTLSFSNIHTHANHLELANIIYDKYSEYGRYYHNVKHIMDMLDYVTLISKDLMYSDKAFLELAIIYHDVIYYAHSTTNEVDSVKRLRVGN